MGCLLFDEDSGGVSAFAVTCEELAHLALHAGSSQEFGSSIGCVALGYLGGCLARFV
jgi:hypothetical protein